MSRFAYSSHRTRRAAARATARAAFTMLEVMFASLIASGAAAYLGYLMLYTAKSEAVIIPQMQRQMSAARAIQAVADELRNAKTSTIRIYSGMTLVTDSSLTGDSIFFQSLALPAGQYACFRFVNSSLVYFPNVANWSTRHVVARNLENVRFSPGQVIQIVAVFKYRKYEGYNQSEQQRMNGTFRTEVYPRNS